MDHRIRELLGHLRQDDQGIWCGEVRGAGQEGEIELRKSVASQAPQDLLGALAPYHSVEVMDFEVDRALSHFVPSGGIIADIGGCWGWHWRRLGIQRPDANVLIVDFVKENLLNAKRLLADQVGRNVHLVHGDATQLPFPDGWADLYWSVQVLQHVPDFAQALREAQRVLKEGGWFVNYSLNRALGAELVYKLAGRDYVVAGHTKQFWLARATSAQREEVGAVFGQPVGQRFSEILFQPNFGLRTGRPGSALGRIDAHLSSGSSAWAWVARQRSFEVRKSGRRVD